MKIHFDEQLKNARIQQRTVVYNDTNEPIKTLGLHAWMNAYGRRLTALGIRKLQDRNSSLYFSHFDQRGKVSFMNLNLEYNLHDDEFISIPLDKPMEPKDSIILEMDYSIKIPEDFVTHYGRRENFLLLKYFNLQPVKIYKDGQPQFQHYIDLEVLPLKPSYYDVEIINKFDKIESNLTKIDSHHFKGFQLESFILSVNPEQLRSYRILNTDVAIDFKIDSSQVKYIQTVLERQLRFLKTHYAFEPKKILLTSKTKKLENFTGIDDIEIIGKFKISFFTAHQQIDLKLFQMVTYESLKQQLNTDLESNHWILNGLLVYIQINYIREFYKDLKLAGSLPEDIRIRKFKPLKMFFAADLNLTDRYKLAYLYIVSQNYEQNIDTKFSEFNNINQTIISGFKTGIGFNYMSEYVGGNKFNTVLDDFIKHTQYNYFTAEDFQNYFETNIHKNIHWFFSEFISSSDKLNFKFRSINVVNDSIQMKIENTTNFAGPFKVVAFQKDSIMASQWYDSKGKVALYDFPEGDYDKLVINPGYMLPEFDYRDNYIYTHGFFKNSKKVKAKLYVDIDNPEYYQIFITPRLKWNNYDKFILGSAFSNTSLMKKPFYYKITPSYSFGTSNLTGSGSISYSILPEKSWFREITIGTSASYYHYDTNLRYLSISNYATFDFKKDPRSSLTRNINLSYQIIDKQPNPNDPEQIKESLKYNMFKATFYYRDDKMIYENQFKADLELANPFQKISAEFYSRNEIVRNKKLVIRWFGSAFLNNNSQSDYFSTGISNISDYSFGYNLLARSATSGFLSQQYVMAEGGFISKSPVKVSQWITTLHTEYRIWKPFNFYAGIGEFKNKFESPQFIYEMGIKFNFLPDFFELYFPIQSTLGFEPSLENYASRIRFTFSFSLGKLTSYFRRGWF